MDKDSNTKGRGSGGHFGADSTVSQYLFLTCTKLKVRRGQSLRSQGYNDSIPNPLIEIPTYLRHYHLLALLLNMLLVLTPPACRLAADP